MLVYVAFASNKGDRGAYINSALEQLRSAQGIARVKVSGIIETKPVDCPPGTPDFLNGVAEVETTRTVRQLFSLLQHVERQLGRERGPTKPPKTIDLDLILFGDEIVNEPDLVVPHPRMHERFFVLDPLLEIAPEVRDPRTGERIVDIRANRHA